MLRTIDTCARAALALCLASAPLAARSQAAGQSSPASRPPQPLQIEWQRSLEDALALSKATDRPLLVAINMDAESGCERIVHEQYADPAFVAATREFVCVVAHPLRHNGRDHDDDGRRIACPRLGEVTCGEHVALEPVLFDKYLSDGERVAPRHALILQDGKKAWDLSLIFDIRELDRAVLASAEAERARRKERGLADAPFDPPSDAQRAPLDELAARRSHRDRLALEARIAAARDEQELAAIVKSIGAHGNAGSLDALRGACMRAIGFGEPLRASIVGAARELGLDDAFAAAVRDRIRSPGRFAGAWLPSGEERLLGMLAELDGKSAATRTLLIACAALEGYGPPVREALARAFGAAEMARLQPYLAAPDMPVAIGRALDGDDAGRALVYTPVPDPIDEELAELETLPPAEELEQRLTELEARLKDAPKDAATMARYASAALGLARRRIESKGQGAQFFLEDAEVWLARALELEPAHYAWWIVRARAAFLRERYREQAEHATRAWAIAKAAIDKRVAQAAKEAPAAGAATPNGGSVLRIQRELAQIVEASRWLGDAHARLLAERSGKDPVEELQGFATGARALSTVLTSPASDAQDWISMSSFLGAVGLWREELAILQAGAARLPADVELRQRLNNALWNGGRIDLAPAKAEWIASRASDSVDAAWFAGHAWILGAEDLRRRMDADGAIALYQRAQERFEGVIAAKPEYADNSRHFLALAWHGRGMAHLIADRRGDAAQCLIEAARASKTIQAARDGLDRDVLDLVDQSLEWRASGPSPVNALALLGQLDDAAPGDPFWSKAVADAELREALRADGRSDTWAEREVAAADGTTKKERVRLPNAEGDRFLDVAIEAAKRVRALGDTPELRRPLAQCATIQAERALVRGELDVARRGLALAAPELGLEVKLGDAGREALVALAAKLRAELGEPRPVNRPGR